MKEKIYLSSPHMGGDELSYINEAFETNWISPVGPNIAGFEKDLCTYNNISHAAALSSGTAAIHLALIILGIERGDEVICSTFTFSASANPIIYQGATPVFVDSEKETWNMDPELLERAINERKSKGKKPKAIILVHLYGMPAKIEALMAIARKHEIPVIEDAAEALGATHGGKKLGTFGEIGIYSFNGNKIITTSGGGAMVSNNNEYIEKAKFLATQARDNAPHYQHSEIGYNYRMSNICAGIGRGQMKVLDKHIARRREIFEAYYSILGKMPGVSFLEAPVGSFSNRWLTTLLIDPSKTGGNRRDDVCLALENQNIESRPLWKPMHLQPVFQNYLAYENGTSQWLFDHGLCLPSGSNLTDLQMDRILDEIKKSLG